MNFALGVTLFIAIMFLLVEVTELTDFKAVFNPSKDWCKHDRWCPVKEVDWMTDASVSVTTVIMLIFQGVLLSEPQNDLAVTYWHVTTGTTVLQLMNAVLIQSHKVFLWLSPTHLLAGDVCLGLSLAFQLDPSQRRHVWWFLFILSLALTAGGLLRLPDWEASMYVIKANYFVHSLVMICIAARAMSPTNLTQKELTQVSCHFVHLSAEVVPVLFDRIQSTVGEPPNLAGLLPLVVALQIFVQICFQDSDVEAHPIKMLCDGVKHCLSPSFIAHPLIWVVTLLAMLYSLRSLASTGAVTAGDEFKNAASPYGQHYGLSEEWLLVITVFFLIQMPVVIGIWTSFFQLPAGQQAEELFALAVWSTAAAITTTFFVHGSLLVSPFWVISTTFHLVCDFTMIMLVYGTFYEWVSVATWCLSILLVLVMWWQGWFSDIDGSAKLMLDLNAVLHLALCGGVGFFSLQHSIWNDRRAVCRLWAVWWHISPVPFAVFWKSADDLECYSPTCSGRAFVFAASVMSQIHAYNAVRSQSLPKELIWQPTTSLSLSAKSLTVTTRP